MIYKLIFYIYASFKLMFHNIGMQFRLALIGVGSVSNYIKFNKLTNSPLCFFCIQQFFSCADAWNRYQVDLHKYLYSYTAIKYKLFNPVHIYNLIQPTLLPRYISIRAKLILNIHYNKLWFLRYEAIKYL